MPTGFDEQTLQLLGFEFNKRSKASADFKRDVNENDGSLTGPHLMKLHIKHKLL